MIIENAEPCGDGKEWVEWCPIPERFALCFKVGGNWHYQLLMLSIRGGNNQPRLEAAERLYKRLNISEPSFKRACG